MEISKKVDTIYQWLKEGYTIYGISSGEMWIDGKYIRYSHFGSSVITISKKSVHFLLTKIFDDVSNFYIIKDNEMQCTDKRTAYYCNNVSSDFVFYDADNGSKLFVYLNTITDMLINMQNITEQYYKQFTNDNVVRFKVERKLPLQADKDFKERTKMLSSWNFAI